MALSFGWGKSPLWLTQIIGPPLGKLRERHEFRVLSYLDDFLNASFPNGVLARPTHCVSAKMAIQRLLTRLGLTRYPTRGEGTVFTVLEHFGVEVDTETMHFYVTPHEVERIQSLAHKMLM